MRVRCVCTSPSRAQVMLSSATMFYRTLVCTHAVSNCHHHRVGSVVLSVHNTHTHTHPKSICCCLRPRGRLALIVPRLTPQTIRSLATQYEGDGVYAKTLTSHISEAYSFRGGLARPLLPRSPPISIHQILTQNIMNTPAIGARASKTAHCPP